MLRPPPDRFIPLARLSPPSCPFGQADGSDRAIYQRVNPWGICRLSQPNGDRSGTAMIFYS